MQTMESRVIRQKFLEFFKSKQNEIVASAPMVVKNDPTLMFTNAGMNQFKDNFLGHNVPKSTRVADTQKCLRVSGKHNDLEEVGIDTYHHTMFEMLGNWSFGDYFKAEAIDWAWELLTKVYGLPPERMYASVFEGDKSENLEFDQEAFDYWSKYLPEERILNGSKKDNFWEMGDSGPCGPCSELHIDLRSEEEIAKVPGRDLVNNDHPQVVEIWNLVFIQFNRKANGSLEDLPAKHVDTGMGFERLAMAIQGKKSNYDTDVFQPMISFLADKVGIKYSHDEKQDIALRVVVDHIRAIAFAIADGQLPSNTGAGYVIRRILRRAVRYGFTFLERKEPFLFELVGILEKQMGEVFPELKSQMEFIIKVVREEEISFLRTLDKGLKKLDVLISGAKSKVINGKEVFELYDTYGFPVDLTSLIARENGMGIDEDAFKSEMALQKGRSKADAVKETGDWHEVTKGESVEFVGYDYLESSARILKHRTIKQKGKELIQVVLDRTPFYAESGGQVGDIGYLASEGEKISVLDTKKENDLIVHFVNKLPNKIEAPVRCQVNIVTRELTMKNHSATHLMHAALREVLGMHVEQRGSLVNEKMLRFDFSHFAKLSSEEIKSVEEIVNTRIRENIILDVRTDVPIDQAKEMGAMALFGEKYGDSVRVIMFDKDFSIELCGGTHVPATGNIGSFKIISESSIAAGIRRIEAITANEVDSFNRQQETLLEQLSQALKAPKDMLASVNSLMSDKAHLEKQLEQYQIKEANALKDKLASSVVLKDGMSQIFAQVDLPNADVLKNLAFQLRQQVDNLFLILAANIQDKPQIAVMIDDDLVKSKNLNAGAIIRDLAKEIKGGGGGQPFYATAGGKDLSGLPGVIKKAKELFG